MLSAAWLSRVPMLREGLSLNAKTLCSWQCNNIQGIKNNLWRTMWLWLMIINLSLWKKNKPKTRKTQKA